MTLLAYTLFQHDFFKIIAETLNSGGYVSIFVAGFLFTYGFTTPFAIGFFAALAPTVNILPAALLAAVGSLLADLLIFRFIRSSFADELEKFRVSYLFQKISGLFHEHMSDAVKKYVLWTFAGLILASPLPDEVGVSLISGTTKLNQTVFGVIAFSCNFVGILAVLAIVSS